jgi:hypothetical protein
MVRGAVDIPQPRPLLNEEKADQVAEELARKIHALPAENQTTNFRLDESEPLKQLMRDARESGLGNSRVLNTVRQTFEELLDQKQ